MNQEAEISGRVGLAERDKDPYVGGRTPPGPSIRSWDNIAPFWGDFMHEHLSRLAGKYGNVYQLQGADQTLVVLNGLEAVGEALIDKDALFNDRVDFAVLKKKPQCHFLELKSGEPWERHRAVLVESMQAYFAGRWSEVESWLSNEIEDLILDFKRHAGNPFDPNRPLALANLSFIKRMVFGRRCDAWDREHFHEDSVTVIPNGFMNANNESVIPKRLVSLFNVLRRDSLKGFEESINGLSAFIGKYVTERRQELSAQGSLAVEPQDMCDYLLIAERKIPEEDKVKYQLTGEDVVNGSLTQFAGAGTGVSTFVLRWALAYMVQYPDVQRRLHEEMDAALSAAPTLADRSKLPYCQAFINEVLRFAPITPVPAVHYKAKVDTTIDSYFIKRDTPIVVNYYSLTRDLAVWDEPDSFNPDRFIAADGSLRKDLQGKFFPFGLGSRRCIGEHIGRLQLYLLCSNLIYYFSFSSPPGERLVAKAYPGVFMVPKPFRIVALPR